MTQTGRDAREGSTPLSLGGKRVVLMLQGGGALGAYQVGAYRALEEACRRAETSIAWVAGISIGAIHAALIAAPRSGDAANELDRFWAEILAPQTPPYDVTASWDALPQAWRSGWLATLVPKYANWSWLAFNPAGERNFFGSRVTSAFRNPWFRQWAGPLTPDELAFYDTAPLRATLDRHVDWGALTRSGAMRLSLGATRTRDGETTYFNSFAARDPQWGARAIDARHVLASAALPPAFPAVTIDGELYWDGGVVANTPIAALAEDLTADLTGGTIVFLIDLWDRQGAVPRSVDDVLWRLKSLQYGSRKDSAAAVVARHQLEVEAQQVPPTRLEVCQVMRETAPGETQPEFAFADADFTARTYAHDNKLGYDDMSRALEHPERVAGVGGTFSVLYRQGTYDKHRSTDEKFREQRERKRQLMQAYRNAGGSLRDEFTVDASATPFGPGRTAP